jgi:hypothetical protein
VTGSLTAAWVFDGETIFASFYNETTGEISTVGTD